MKKIEQINKYHVKAFGDIMQHLDISKLKVDSYPYSYLKYLLKHTRYHLEIYTTVLNLLLKNTAKKKEELVLIDYGSGNGLLGFFAKFCGFGTVISIDLSEEFCASQHTLLKINHLRIDEIFCGDIESYSKGSAIVPDAIIGTDVIEHIYDLDIFFKSISSLNKNLITVFTTASNNRNWLKRRKLMRIQVKDEWTGWNESQTHKQQLSFREIRKRIIKEITGERKVKDIEKLVLHTRGLNKADIERICHNYLKGKDIPPPIKHPANTCDPITGSWTERLLSYKEYHDIYKKHCFKLSIQNGYYNIYQPFPKGCFLHGLNYIIKNSEKFGNFISPLIILVGVRLLQTEKLL